MGRTGPAADQLAEMLRPIQEGQRQTSERLAKIQHTLDVMSVQQRERDANSNINRDMVFLVILVVMIQVQLLLSPSMIWAKTCAMIWANKHDS